MSSHFFSRPVGGVASGRTPITPPLLLYLLSSSILADGIVQRYFDISGVGIQRQRWPWRCSDDFVLAEYLHDEHPTTTTTNRKHIAVAKHSSERRLVDWRRK